MMLPDMFLQLVLQMGASMTTPTLNSLATIVKGWLFAGRHTLTGVLIAVGGSGPKHHSAYYRLFAAARWSLDAMGLALFHLIVPLLAPGPVPLTLDDTLARKRGYLENCFGKGMVRSFAFSGSACLRLAPKRMRLPMKKRWSLTCAHSAACSTAVNSSGCAVIVNCSA
jgi:hypothetical protein